MPAGRPRMVDDAAILRATVEVMGRAGPARLTLAAVAAEAGVVPGTLVQRFGSKHGLLLALAGRSAADAAGLAARDWREHGTPLAALADLVAARMAAMATPETFANHLAFLCLDLTDPQLHQQALAVHEAYGQAIGTLLAAAAATGELRPGTDVAALTAAVQAITAGAGLTWALDRQGTLADRLRAALATVLSPHRTPRPGLPQEET